MSHPELECQKQLVAMMRKHYGELTGCVNRWQVEASAVIDADCQCDNCLELAVLLPEGDEFLREVRRATQRLSEGTFILSDGTRAQLAE